MNDEQYLDHCKALLSEFAENLSERTRDLPQDHPIRALSASFNQLVTSPGDVHDSGTGLVTRLFSTFPEFAPTLPRQLLWFFGGECLHYMADEEIAQFQQLDELRLAAAERDEIFNLKEARARLLSLH